MDTSWVLRPRITALGEESLTGMQSGYTGQGNRSLQRGLAVLECIREHGRNGIRVAELMRVCELERATVYRLLATLIDAGYVARRGRFLYVPGPRLGGPVIHPPADGLQLGLQRVLRRLSELTGDAAFAVIREGTQSHCIARHIGTYPVQVLVVQVGRRQPLGVGAAGLALLAALPPDEAAAIVTANASGLRAYGGMTEERLHILLRATRERGWSVVGNHVVPDTLGVGYVIRSPADAPLAAISVAAPFHRMPPPRQHRIIQAMQSTVAELLSKSP